MPGMLGLRQDAGGVPDGAVERGQHVGGVEIEDRLRRHAGSEQRDQPAGDGEDQALRNGEQAEIGQAGNRRAGGNAEQAAGEQRRPGSAGKDDAVEEQHDLRAFAQHRHAAHDRQRDQRAAALGNRLADALHFRGEFATVTGHPGIVPGQHDHGDEQDRGVEQFLPVALEQVGDGAGEGGNHAGAGDAPATPSTIHQPRRATPRVAASTMPMIRPASMTSRRTMTNA